MARRKLVIPVVIGAGSFLGTVLYRRRSVRNRTRLDIYFDDGSMVSSGRRIAGCRPADAARRPGAGGRPRGRVNRDQLAARLLERAYLEGDFLLRSGRRSRYYLDKYRFETDPQLLAGLGRELAALVAGLTASRPSCWPAPSWAPCRWRPSRRSRPGCRS